MTNRPYQPVPISLALRGAAIQFEVFGLPTTRLDAEVLLAHCLSLSRTQLLAHRDDLLSEENFKSFAAQAASRISGQPVAYLTGHKEFMALDFAVGPGVLIPRPETEILVEWAIGFLQHRPDATVADVGTGAGAIALSLVLHAPRHRGVIIGSDVSPDALQWAIRNRDNLQLKDRVHLVCGNLVDWRVGPVDLLLANLPYLTDEQIASNRFLAAEPRLALAGRLRGSLLIAALLDDAPRILAPSGTIGLEFDPDQASAVVAMANAVFPGASVRVLPDLAGLDRHVIVQT